MFFKNLTNHTIILASGSPRRLELMNKLDINFSVQLKEVEEKYPPHFQREQITNFLSKLKAKPFLKSLKEKDVLITADTIVWYNEKALGKPKNKTEARAMLLSMSGQCHEVISSISLSSKNWQKSFYDVTKVYFKNLSSEEIEYYVENYNPLDKAGAYGIQEWIGLIAVKRIEGSYFNVMGFPVDKLQQELLKL